MLKGKTISGYTLQQEIGVGRMTEMWLAENAAGNKAAVKLLLPKFCYDEAIVARFQNEAKVTVKLKHPNIQQVLDIGQIDDRPCIVMEYLEGDNLETLMKRDRRFTNVELRHWWDQLASALTYTHAQGVAHCNIKPSNIFIDRGGNVKLLNFGIAKIRDSIATQTEATMETLMYMSPEQVRDSKHVDWHTDVYSLAVTFVHLLTGKPPYNSDTTDDYEIRKNIVEEPLDMSGVSSDWQAFLRPYLVKSPEDRPTLVVFSTIHAAEKPVVQGNVAAQSQRKRIGLIVGVIWVMLLLGAIIALLLSRGGSENSQETEHAVTDSIAKVDTTKTALVEDTTEVAPEEDTLLAKQKAEAEAKAKRKADLEKQGYVDLGLSVYWKNSNEWNSADDHGLYTYDDAKHKFGNRLPSKAKWEELENKCTWTWTGSGYNVKGPNGNKIYLPAAGLRLCIGSVGCVGSGGDYWSSTPYNSDYAWSLDFDSGDHDMSYYNRCYGRSVRLVYGE